MGKSKRTESSDTRLPYGVRRMPITQLNPYLMCALCNGYLIDATTMVECLHSFCRACLLSYFDQSATCPICETPVHKTNWQKSIKSDQTLQDLVYKLVPGLYGSELKRRKEFYLSHCPTSNVDNVQQPSSGKSNNSSKYLHIFDKHLVDLASCICTPDEIVSFSLQHSNTSNSHPVDEKSKDEGKKDNLNFKRYFRCPAAVKIGHLKKLLTYKLDLPQLYKIVISCDGQEQSDDLTLMDLAYIFSWRRKTPLQLVFDVFKCEFKEESMPELHRQMELPPNVVDSTADEWDDNVPIAKLQLIAKNVLDTPTDKTSESQVVPKLCASELKAIEYQTPNSIAVAEPTVKNGVNIADKPKEETGGLQPCGVSELQFESVVAAVVEKAKNEDFTLSTSPNPKKVKKRSLISVVQKLCNVLPIGDSDFSKTCQLDSDLLSKSLDPPTKKPKKKKSTEAPKKPKTVKIIPFAVDANGFGTHANSVEVNSKKLLDNNSTLFDAKLKTIDAKVKLLDAKSKNFNFEQKAKLFVDNAKNFDVPKKETDSSNVISLNSNSKVSEMVN